jgi:immune inhibitor A
MMRKMSLFGLVWVMLAALLTVKPELTTQTEAQLMPPHPDLLEKIQDGTLKLPQNMLDGGITDSIGFNALGEQSKAMTGTLRTLAVLVDFSDKQRTVTASFFDSLLYAPPVAGRGSVRDYFHEVSYGQIDIVTVNMPSSIGWKRAPQTYAYYVGGNYCMDKNAYPHNCQKLAEDLVAAVDGVVNFADYDNNNDGSVDNFMIIHAGRGAEKSGSLNDVWSHSWNMKTVQTRDGKNLSKYIIMPEYLVNINSSSSDMTIGVFAHEMGHGFWGLPDFYDYGKDSYGVDDWSLMASGAWLGPNNSYSGSSPAWPDAWSRIAMGIVQPQYLIGNYSNLSIPQVLNNPGVNTIFRVRTIGMGAQEYYLIENRQKVSGSYEEHLPGSGLLVWHVDEAMTDNDNQCTTHPSSTCGSSHYRLALVQADGLKELESNAGYADAGDPFPGTSTVRSLSYNTIPDSGSYYSSGDIKFSLSGISDSGSVMSANVTAGETSAVSITDVAVTEGNSGNTNALVTVSLNQASSTAVSVNYALAGNTAMAGTDFPAQSGTLIIPAGSTSQQFPILVTGDLLDEEDETFFVNLSTPVFADLVDNQAIVTIKDDDAPPLLQVYSTAGWENANLMTFSLRLSQASGKTVSLMVSTLDDTALAGQDYTAVTSQLVTFNPGEILKNFTVTLLDDALLEGSEKFQLTLTNAINLTIPATTVFGHILDDEFDYSQVFLPVTVR